ncbi:hypothetical protein DFH06DRAFT_1399241 [Mycena polygramma]|nr:hypothetical protein DFH06DRAFT_1399241 [Mycena polygramma]
MTSSEHKPFDTDLTNVPFDVWGCIFTAVLESSKSSPPQYAYLRRRLCNVCKAWQMTIYSRPSFWSTIFLHKRTTLRSVAKWTELSGALPLTISLHLHRDAVISPPETLWRILRPTLDRISVLAISAFDEQSLLAAISSLQNNTFQTLSAFTVYAGIFARRFTLDQRILSRFVVPSSVAFLRLHGVRVDWPRRASWHSLTSLVLIDQASIMSWRDFQRISEEAVQLTYLAMRDVGCCGLPSTLERIVFPTITHFFLVFGGGASGTVLLEHFDMPRLTHFRFHGTRPHRPMIMSLSPALLSVVRSIVLSGITDVAFYSLLFARLPLLECLKMLDSDRGVLRGIMEADSRLAEGPGQPELACSRLTCIHASEATPRDLQEFLDHRCTRADMLPDVIFFGKAQATAGWTEKALTLLRSRTKVVMASKETEDPRWLSIRFRSFD